MGPLCNVVVVLFNVTKLLMDFSQGTVDIEVSVLEEAVFVVLLGYDCHGGLCGLCGLLGGHIP
eukprot:8266444-Ditylum_brightwellii.AAC.1